MSDTPKRMDPLPILHRIVWASYHPNLRHVPPGLGKHHHLPAQMNKYPSTNAIAGSQNLVGRRVNLLRQPELDVLADVVLMEAEEKRGVPCTYTMKSVHP